MKHIIFFTILTAFGLQSCNIGTSETWKDENIEQSIKNEILTFDKKVLQAVTTNNPDLIKTIMSDKLLEKSGDNIHQLIEQAGSVILNSDFRILNQFHVKNSNTDIGNTVMSGVSGLNDYVLNYLALNEEMFISLIIPENDIDEFIVANIYGKYPEGWKLNILQFGQYKVNGQTAPELFVKAKKEYEKGYLVDASNNMFLSSRVANPANNFWKYQKEDEMKQFYENIIGEIKTKYTFPLIMESIGTKPQIVNIFPQGMQEGYFPMVEYLTNINLKDTLKTKEENNQIHQTIGQIFKGIDKDKKYLFYKAYGEMPNGKTPVPTYGFVKELK